jgi:5-methylthioribose kinase
MWMNVRYFASCSQLSFTANLKIKIWFLRKHFLNKVECSYRGKLYTTSGARDKENCRLIEPFWLFSQVGSPHVILKTIMHFWIMQ